MGAAPQIDYATLAAQSGGKRVIDYAGLAAQHGGKPVTSAGNAADAAPEPFWEGLAKGAGKGLASTVFNAGDLLRRGEIGIAQALGVEPEDIPEGVRSFFGLDRVIDRPEVQESITPASSSERLGYGLEHLAEYIVPATRVAHAMGLAEVPGAAGVIARALAQGATAGGVAGAQTGGNPTAMASAAALGAGGSAAMEALPAAYRGIKAAAGNGVARDVVGVVSPRAGRTLDLLGKIRAKFSTPMADAEAAVPAAQPRVTLAGEPEQVARPAWRQQIVDELNPSSAAGAENVPQAQQTIAAPAPGPQVEEPGEPNGEAVQQLLDAAKGLAARMAARAPRPTVQRVAQSVAETAPEASAAVRPTLPPITTTGLAPEGLEADVQLPQTAPNRFEAAARTEKARKLAEFLYSNGNGIPSEDAVRMNPEQWELAAQGARVHTPSAKTAGETLQELQRLEQSRPIATQIADSVKAAPAAAASESTPAVSGDGVSTGVVDLNGKLVTKAAPTQFDREAATSSAASSTNSPNQDAMELAKALHQGGNGISVAQGMKMNPGQWKRIADALGLPAPNHTMVLRTLFYLTKLEKANAPAKALAETMK